MGAQEVCEPGDVSIPAADSLAGFPVIYHDCRAADYRVAENEPKLRHVSVRHGTPRAGALPSTTTPCHGVTEVVQRPEVRRASLSVNVNDERGEHVQCRARGQPEANCKKMACVAQVGVPRSRARWRTQGTKKKRHGSTKTARRGRAGGQGVRYGERASVRDAGGGEGARMKGGVVGGGGREWWVLLGGCGVWAGGVAGVVCVMFAVWDLGGVLYGEAGG